MSEKKVITQVFCEGAFKGWNIWMRNVAPNIVMAFVLIKFMNQSGILGALGKCFAPVMGVFNLPGEAAMVVLGAWMSVGGAVGVAAAMFEQGTLTLQHVAILTPCMFILASQIQYLGRIIGVIGTIKGKEMIPLFVIPVVLGILSLFVMRFIV